MMISRYLSAAMMAGALFMSQGASAQMTSTTTAARTIVTPQEGTVYSFHSVENAGCPALDWHVRVGTQSRLSGMIATEDMKHVWRVDGGYTTDRKFVLTGKEIGGAERSGTVNGEIREDGALVAVIGNITGASPCNNKMVYIPWFRGGNNAYDPSNGNSSGGGGG